MPKITVTTIKEAAKAAAELMDSSAPEVKLLLENPNFAIGLCLVLHKEVVELRNLIQDMQPNENPFAQVELPENQKPAPAAQAPEQPAQPTQSLAEEQPQPAAQPAPIMAEQAPQPVPQSVAPVMNQIRPQPKPQLKPQATQPTQSRQVASPKNEEPQELFA